MYGSSSKGVDIYAKNNKFKKYLNAGNGSKHQKQFKSKRSTSRKAKMKKNPKDVSLNQQELVIAEMFDDERAANSAF